MSSFYLFIFRIPTGVIPKTLLPTQVTVGSTSTIPPTATCVAFENIFDLPLDKLGMFSYISSLKIFLFIFNFFSFLF